MICAESVLFVHIVLRFANCRPFLLRFVFESRIIKSMYTIFQGISFVLSTDILGKILWSSQTE